MDVSYLDKKTTAISGENTVKTKFNGNHQYNSISNSNLSQSVINYKDGAGHQQAF
jgi:hypothetical protein